MANMDPKKTPMPEQTAGIRSGNFEEVALGYTPEMAVGEAKRCLGCKNKPCVAGCPVAVRIPEFIGAIAEGDFPGAYGILRETNSLPAVCGRVCPQETQCEAKCVRGIRGEPVAIGRLERFAADCALARKGSALEPQSVSGGRRVAVVGAGPAGLTCAGDLARAGCAVTLFEAFHLAGGVLVYGIPEFRLPKEIVRREIEALQSAGVEIVTNAVIGRSKTVDDLFAEGYEAVFLGTGAGLPSFLGIPGESLLGVCSANEFLTRVNLMKSYRDDYDTPSMRFRSVAVIGGGNVAMDAARCAVRLGAEQVTVVYRRSEQEMPARAEEIHHAKEEGVRFRLLCNPTEILGDADGNVRALRCVEMELGEPDESGRRRPVPKADSEFEVMADGVILAIGTSPNPLIRNTTAGLEVNRRGCIVADDTMATTRPGVFAGGDTVTGAATVILAMGAGKTAARSILEYLAQKG